MVSRQEHDTKAGPAPSPPACPIRFSSLKYDSSRKKKAPKSRTFDVESVAVTGVLTQKDQEALRSATRAMLARQNKNLRATNPRKDQADKSQSPASDFIWHISDCFTEPKHEIPPRAGKSSLSKTIVPPRTDGGIQAPGLTVAYPDDTRLVCYDLFMSWLLPESSHC